jgi:hypothetical protein
MADPASPVAPSPPSPPRTDNPEPSKNEKTLAKIRCLNLPISNILPRRGIFSETQIAPILFSRDPAASYPRVERLLRS